jgi:hypothetical protein
MNANDFPPEFLNKQQAERNAQGSRKLIILASLGGSELVLKEVYQTVGCAMEVLNEVEWERIVLSSR